MDDRPAGAPQALVGSLDQLATALREDLDRDVVGDQTLFDQLADEVVVRLRRRREPDLDLLEAHADEGLEHLQLAGRIHRVDERLVAVAQVHRAPDRGVLDLVVWPLAVREAERQGAEGHVLLDRHLLRVDGYGRHLGFLRALSVSAMVAAGGGVCRGNKNLLQWRRRSSASTHMGLASGEEQAAVEGLPVHDAA